MPHKLGPCLQGMIPKYGFSCFVPPVWLELSLGFLEPGGEP
jgi:hypothetical protein